MKHKYKLLFYLVFMACQPKGKEATVSTTYLKGTIANTSVVLLGTLQDAGSPHINCTNSSILTLFQAGKTPNKVICLGLFDAENQQQYLYEATPDLPKQLYDFNKITNVPLGKMPDDIFLSHAHIGHYTGLMYLEKKAGNANGAPVFAIPRMQHFLRTNEPRKQLVKMGDIQLRTIQHDSAVVLNNNSKVIPFLAPHRNEYSETVGYKIIEPQKTALFLPYINKWNKWEPNILEEIKKVDFAFLDVAFYNGKEINNRDISQIPHPFVIESLEIFKSLYYEERKKVIFIYVNHTNPVIDSNSEEAISVLNDDFRLGKLYDIYEL